LNDGVIDTELVWDVELTCAPVSVEGRTWAQVKSLYR
jgi:hypothetical protein